MEQRKQKVGKIVPNGVRLQAHEYDTVLYFTEMGKEVELIKPSYTPGRRNADFVMDGVEWEMKAPLHNRVKTIERTFYQSAYQSSNVVMDLRRMKGSDTVVVRSLRKCFNTTRKIRRMYVIRKNGELEMYQK